MLKIISKVQTCKVVKVQESKRSVVLRPVIPVNKLVHVEETGKGKYVNRIIAGSHNLIADEPGAIPGGLNHGIHDNKMIINVLKAQLLAKWFLEH